jgi:hypothetical protein
MRPGRSGPEATQEIDASDVLEVIAVPIREPRSYPSLMKVGVDVEVGRYEETCQIRLAARRKQLSRYVIGAVAISCGILLASFVKREAAASSSPASAMRAPTPRVAAATAPTMAALPSIPAPPPATIPPPPPPVAPPESSATTSGSGSIRLAAPAKPGWVWLDGKRLSATSAFVSCGTHQVKVGYYAKHTVVVPCGGEVVVSR